MSPYVIGIEIGRNETSIAALDSSGRVLGRGRCTSFDYAHADSAVISVELLSAVQAASKQAGIDLAQIECAAWALPAELRPAERRSLADLSAEILPGASVLVVDDPSATLVGGSNTRHGIVLTVGAKVVVYGRNEQGNEARAGGWGPLLDGGGAYALARDGFAAVARAADSERVSTSLTKRILHTLGLENPSDLLQWLYDPRRKTSEIADLAQAVLCEAEAGDVSAVEVVARGADALADAVATVAHRLGFQENPFPLVLSGDLLTANDFYRDVVTQSVLTRLPSACCTFPKAGPSVGASLIALESLGYGLMRKAEVLDAPVESWVSEQANILTRDLDLRSTHDIVGLMHVEDRRAVDAVGLVLPEIALVVDAIAVRMRRGGRLIYVGGGTSGRLGVLDASECPATFNATPEQVVGVMAGGVEALLFYGGPDEDDEEAGRQALADLEVSSLDSVVGITASGRTPYTLAAIEEARRRGALTIALVCNQPAPLARMVDHVIAPLVGPEVLSGSTRLKAGTAQKLVLNMLSTAVMVRLGKVYGNLMVDVLHDNEKLRDRAQRIVVQICRVSQEEAAVALASTQGDVKAAAVCVLAKVLPSVANERLARAEGILRVALAGASPEE